MAKGSKDKESRSLLEAALRAFEAGDVVTARRAARQVVQKPTEEDQAAARRVALKLRGDDAGDVPAEILADEIAKRSSPILRPYLWALGGVSAYVLLLIMALVRYG